MGVVGGAVIPFVQGLINDSISFTAALSVIFASLLLILIFTFNLKKNVQ
jgi:fucose permease